MVELPTWAKQALGADGYERIEAAIARAEASTSGEIVPLLVRRSSTTGHVPLLATTLLLIGALIADLPGWLSAPIGHVAASAAIVWFTCAVAGYAASRLDLVARVLTPRGDQMQQVDLRAAVEFYDLGMSRTEGRTGVLLMISLLEHRAVVLADRGISEKLDPEVWQQVVDLMVDGVKGRDLAAGMSAAIERCGDLLAEHFPIAADDANELRDHLVVKE